MNILGFYAVTSPGDVQTSSWASRHLLSSAEL